MGDYPTKSSSNPDNELGLVQTTRSGEVHELGLVDDAVFGQLDEESPKYRNVSLLGTIALMMKTQIGLGVLSIPSVFDTLGMIPGIICLIVIGAITTWSDYMIGVFKLKHPEVYAINDVGGMLFGRVGREALGSGILSISIALNALSTHAACTAIFVAVGAVIGFVFSSIRTLGKITLLAWAGCGSIIIAMGVQDRPAAAPQQGPWSSDYKIVGDPTFIEAITSIGSIVFAYAGTPAFFSIIAEMKDPRQYTKALVVCQTTISVVYIVIGIVVYYFCGSYVASPALGSAGATMKKVCYGLALPGLCIGTVLLCHFPAKYVFIRILRGSKHLTSNTTIHWITWLGCTSGVTLISYIVASAVPVFGGLVSLVGALFATLLSFHPYAGMWLYDNWQDGKRKPTKTWLL
ncbi:unnamed protein product, partial [Aureobasidium uvarum]